MALSTRLHFALFKRLVRTIDIRHGFERNLVDKKDRLFITLKRLAVAADVSVFGVMCDQWLRRSSIAISGTQDSLRKGVVDRSCLVKGNTTTSLRLLPVSLSKFRILCCVWISPLNFVLHIFSRILG